MDKVVTLTKNDENRYRDVKIEAVTIPNMISFPIQEHKYNGNRIISVGRLHPQKGYDLLIQALPDVFKEYPEWNIDIYGEGEDRKVLQKMIDERNLASHINLRGYTENISHELSNSDICVVSSRYEGFPMSITEALALGTPVVSFDCPEGPATLLEGGAGVLVPPENIVALTEGIKKMIQSPTTREECRKNGYKSISRFSPDNITRKWFDLFEKIGLNREKEI